MGMGLSRNNAPYVSVYGDKIVTPFGPIFYETNVSEDVVNYLLEEGSLIPDDPNDYHSKIYKKKSIQTLEPMILEKVGKFIDGSIQAFGLALPPEDSLSIDSMWINYQKQYDIVAIHSHTCLLQFVIYCDVPDRIFTETGRHDPRLPGRVSFEYGENITPFSNQTYMVTPRRGQMIIFPGRLHHQVFPFYSEDVRISVAGSIVTSKPENS